MGKLLALFVIVPLVELYLLIQLGGLFGFWPTVGLVLLTGALGAWLVRLEGLRVLSQWQQALQAGRLPADGVLGSVLLLAGAVLLITPGLITDVVGLVLLVPQTRALATLWLRPWLQRRIDSGTIRVVSTGRPDERRYDRDSDPDVGVSPRKLIETEGELVDMEGEEESDGG